ncbi:MAG: hypothetical protein M3428_01375, partial [Pseudomonadota bacterium]|nr:hypothetical protein [Pseudomonadota bacterium]
MENHSGTTLFGEILTVSIRACNKQERPNELPCDAAYPFPPRSLGAAPFFCADRFVRGPCF